MKFRQATPSSAVTSLVSPLLSALCLIVLAISILLAQAPPAPAATPEPGYIDTVVADGLDTPVGIAFLPDGRLLVTEQPGNLVRVEHDGSLRQLGHFDVCSGGELGLLGVAVDPAFDTNGRAYLYMTKPGPGPGPCADGNAGRVNEVVAVEISGDEVVPGSEDPLLSGIRTDNGNHNGGGLRIGPDGKLYVGVGDTGLGDCNCNAPGEATNPYSQDLSELEGKLLRLDLDGGVPADNPFVGVGGAREEIYAYGMRNPWRYGFDPRTDELWLGDVGQVTKEEIDIVKPGRNYGWPYCEGLLPASSACDDEGGLMPPGGGGPLTDYSPPVFSYGPPDSYGSAVMGGSFADLGSGACANASGPGCDYFFGDYAFWNNGDKVYRVPLNDARDGFAGLPQTVVSDAGAPVDLITGPGGDLYYIALGDGELHRLTVPRPPSAGPGAQTPPGKGGAASPPRRALDRAPQPAAAQAVGDGAHRLRRGAGAERPREPAGQLTHDPRPHGAPQPRRRRDRAAARAAEESRPARDRASAAGGPLAARPDQAGGIQRRRPQGRAGGDQAAPLEPGNRGLVSPA